MWTRIEKYFWMILAAGILAFTLGMTAHGWAQDTTWVIKVIVYDARAGVVLTYGTAQTGPVLFKDRKECEAALKGDPQVKLMLINVEKSMHEQLPGASLKAICLSAVDGERVD